MANLFKSPITKKFFQSDEFVFDGFPTINYDFKGDGQTVAIKNFLKRFSFRDSIRNNASAYSAWVIRDEDTPEVMAHRLYESPHYYWVILMLNRIVNPLFDWPLTDRELYRYVEALYGVSQVYAHNHYKAGPAVEIEDLPEGMIVDSRYHRKVSVSNYQHEFDVNESKRSIMLLKPELLPEVLQEWESIKESGFTEVNRNGRV